MKLGATLSAGLHAGIIAVVWFGLPHLRSDPPVLDDIVFVKLADLGDVTNVPPEAAKPDQPKPDPKPEPPKARPKPPPPPVRQAAIPAPPPPPRPAPVQPPEPKPEVAPVVVPPKPRPKPAAPKPEPVVTPPKPAPRPKPRPTTPQPKPTPKVKLTPPKPKPAPVEKKFSSLLKNLKKDRPPEPTPAKPKPEKSLVERAREAARNQSNRAFDPNQEVTVSEIEAVRRQIAQCWNIATGARQADALAVEIEMVMNPDATVREAKVVDRARMNTDPFYRAAAESALRALSHPNCIPLKLPLDKYGIWKTFTFNFDPKDMLQ